MKKLAAIIGLALLLLCGLPVFAQADDAFQDPFTCDPYTFVFDFPLKCTSPYDSVQYSMLVRSTINQAQTVTVSMWPEYMNKEHYADSSWFTIEPASGPLPSGSVMAFTLNCKPPFCELEDLEYSTFFKVTTVYNNGYTWWRVLGVKVRIGSAVPVVDYGIESYKLAQINGQEKTAYTQDQITITVYNNAATSNEFCLYPVTPRLPSGDIDPNAQGDFKALQEFWRDSTAMSVSGQPKEDSYNSATKKYNEYALFMDDGKEFGAFLAGSYSRSSDEVSFCYPFRVSPKHDEAIPFTLRVNKGVPSGIYRLQVHVKPCGISTEATTGAGVGIEYECKMILRVNRGAVGSGSSSKAWIPLAVFGGVAGAWGVFRFGKMRFRKMRTKVA